MHGSLSRLLRKVFKVLGILIAVFFCGFLLFGLVFHLECRSAQPNFRPAGQEIPARFQEAENGIQDYRRPEASTYLTFPEWYLVFNPQEYGRFIAERRPSDFPYFASIGQFWCGYCEVYGIANKHYPFNAGDQLMEAVIGTSFSAEYAGKGAWENTIGRLAEWAGGTKTEEDAYAARVAQEYGSFVPTDPWYEFPFGNRLAGLWKGTSLFGPHLARKWERKTFLSLEYGIKALYAALIRLGTHAVYGVADTEIYAAVQDAPESLFQDRRVRKKKDLGNGCYLITLPHYQGFTDTAPSLARQGVQFVDLAGNGEILLTAIAPPGWKYDLSDGRLLFTMNMMTSAGKRIAVQAPTRSLSKILNQLEAEKVELEHLFDY